MFKEKVLSKYVVVSKIITDRERAELFKQKAKEIMRRGPRDYGSDDSRDGSKQDKKPRLKVEKTPEGALIFPGAKSQPRKSTRTEKQPDEVEKVLKLLGEDRAGFESYLNRFPEEEAIRIAKDLLTARDEPYSHDLHNKLWRGNKQTPNLPTPQRVEDLRGTLGKRVPEGHGDPFHWMDAKFKISYNLLRKHKGKDLTINTGSDLLAHDDYIEALDKNKHQVNFHLLGLPSAYLRRIEPGAPSNDRRIKAVEKLVKSGVKVSAVIDVFEGLPADLKKVMDEEVKELKSHLSKVSVKLNKVKLSPKEVKKILDAVEDLRHKAG